MSEKQQQATTHISMYHYAVPSRALELESAFPLWECAPSSALPDFADKAESRKRAGAEGKPVQRAMFHPVSGW